MGERKKQSMLNGALILVIATMLVKVIGMLYKIPLTALIGEVGRGYFNSAYDIYTPIYAISMAGLPVAVSRMVSENVALHRYRDARMIFKVAFRLFFITGVLGTLILVFLAYPYSNFLIKSPQTLPSILSIALSVLFCCMLSAYRGYYEGLSNMTPTAVSQVMEALGKLVLGLGMAQLVMKFGLSQYHAGGPVFGIAVASEAEAYSAIFPYTAAAAIGGVTLGTVLSLIYLMIRHKLIGDKITRTELVNSPKPRPSKEIAKMLISVSIPIVASALVLNITNFIDSVTLQNRLAYAVNLDLNTIKQMYATAIEQTQTLDKDIPKYLFGVYGAVLDFRNLIPTITMSLGVSAIPALSAAWAIKEKQNIKVTIESVIRIGMLISLPAGIGMAVLAEPVLQLIYGSSLPYMVPIAAPLLATYGYAMSIMSISTPITNMLQAIGRADVPVKSLIYGAIVKFIINFILVGNPNYNIKGAPVGTVFCYIVIVGYNLFFLLKESKVKINYVSILFKPLFCSALCGVAAYTSYGIFSRVLNIGDESSMLNSGNIATLIAIVAAVLVYAIALLFTRAISKDDVVMLPKGKKIAKILEKYGLIG